MVKAILFDFWGTIVENGVFPSPVRQVNNTLALDMEFSEYIGKFEEALMSGKFDDLTQAFTKVYETFNLEPNAEKIEQLVGLWNKNKFFAKPYPDTKNTFSSCSALGVS